MDSSAYQTILKSVRIFLGTFFFYFKFQVPKVFLIHSRFLWLMQDVAPPSPRTGVFL